jgi:hypothetical protein
MPKLLTNLDAQNVGRIVNLPLPINPGDVATKAYVDSTAQGLVIKAPVRLKSASGVNVNIASAPASFDSVLATATDRILLADQTLPAQNGIYVFNGAGVAMTRAIDFNAVSNVKPGSFVFVEEGGQADTGWVMTADNPIVVGTTPLTWAQFSGAGMITAGAAMEKAGNTLNVKVDSTTVQINGSNQLEVVSAVRFGSHKVVIPVGNGSATSFVITHNLNTEDLTVQIRDTTTDEIVIADVVATSLNTATVSFISAPGVGQYAVTLIG